MARTIRDIVDYFPHYANASDGDTLTVLQSRFGNDGYAFWFKLLEKLASSDGHFVDCRNPLKWQLFIARMGISEITTVEMLNLLVEMQAIDKELWQSKLIWSDNLVKNLADVYKNRKRQLPLKPIVTGNNVITTPDNPISTTNLPIETPQSKVKYSKVNNSKLKKEILKKVYGEFKNVHLSDEEYLKLEERFNSATMAKIENLSSYKASKGKTYKSDYATILTWARKDDATLPAQKPVIPNEPINSDIGGVNPEKFKTQKYNHMVQH